MGVVCTTGSRTFESVDQGAHTVDYLMGASYTGNKFGAENLFLRVETQINGVLNQITLNGRTSAENASWDSDDNGQQMTITADEASCRWRGFCNDTSTYNGSWKYFKSHAVTATASEPSSANIDHNSAEISAAFYPNTLDSTATVQLQYKKTVDSEWTNFGDSAESDGYAEDTTSLSSVSLTGLDSSTSYDVRMYMTRDTVNATELYSDTHTFETTAGTPAVTTDAASSVAHASATLNATVDHNEKDGDLSWRYIDTASYSAPPDDAQGTEVDYDSNPITGDGSGSKGISGLTASTGYTFWAIYEPDVGDKVYGDADTFTTAGDPAEEAADEDLMITQYVDGQYGVATTVYFTLRQPAATSSDLYYTGTAPVQADVKISKDGVYDSTSDNAPAQVASITQLYSLVVSAAEMQADVVDIIISDAAGSAFRDHHIQIRTQMNLGTVVVNAAQKATNTTAVTLTGNGTGAGLSCVGGDNDGKDIDGVLADHTQNYGTLAAYNSSTSVDLDNSTAVATNDYYNGAIILFTGGTGAGQARVITDYDGASYAATLNRALAAAASTDTTYIIIPGSDWDKISPGAELSALPTASSNFADFVQFLFQRFAYQREQTATAFTMRKADGSTEFASNAVDDDGSTQTHDALS